MDVGAGQTTAGEAETPAPRLHIGDFVAFKFAGEHGDRGMLGVRDDTPEGKVDVLCVGGAVVHAEQGDLAVVDRSWLRPSHMVVSASDPGGQVGVVVGVDTVVDLVELEGHGGGGGGLIARSVPPAELRRVTELSMGDYVLSGPWLGRVVELSVDVDVLFDDGAACRVRAAEGKLKSVREDRKLMMRPFNGFYYPGRRVAAATKVFQAARWLNGHFKRGVHVQGTVTKVELASVLVQWLASAPRQRLAQSFAPPPPHQQRPRDLTFFCSDNYYWAVGDRCFFRDSRRHGPRRASGSTTAAGDAASPSDHHHLPTSVALAPTDPSGRSGSSPSPSPAPVVEPTKQQQQLRKSFFRRHSRARQRRRERRHAAFERPMSVAGTRTTAVVLWQDGTRQRGVPSASLSAFISHVIEFVPGDRVITGGAAEPVDGDGAQDDAGAAARRRGVVRSLDFRDRTARVAWLKAAPPGEEPSEVEREETVSVYDLNRDYGHDIFYGGLVARLLPSSESGGGGEDLSWVGHVVDLCDAHIQVKWGDGSASKVLPHEIEVVQEVDILATRDAMGDWVDDDAAVEAAEEDNHDGGPAAAAAEHVEHQQDGTTTGRLLGAFIHALIRLPGEALARGKRYLVGGGSTASMEMSLEDDDSIGYARETTTTTEVVTAPASCCEGGVDGSDENNGKADAGDDCSLHFAQFDVVQQSPRDHHFLDDTEQGAASGGKKWTKRVQKEWKILQDNLPDTIYVRAFEDRMDLLRAAMVGAAGTPYQDGLFFFDVRLPPASYPAEPPRVYYHSFGLSVNPNLDRSGTVCLSLLDTFDGEGPELWSPASSTVLQVLVSIQGLVLTAQPYYNEAAYEATLGTPGGARNALPYAENAYVLALRTMLHLLRRPPAGFEALVRGHFRRRGRFVLRACEAHLVQQGCPVVGTLDGADARVTAERGERRPCSSAGLRFALAGVVPRLVEAFAEIDADGCEEFDRLRVQLGGGGVPP